MMVDWSTVLSLVVTALVVGMAVGSIVQASYWAARAKYGIAVYFRGKFYIVIQECEYLDLKRRARSTDG